MINAVWLREYVKSRRGVWPASHARPRLGATIVVALLVTLASCAPAPHASGPPRPPAKALGPAVNGKIISSVLLSSYHGHVIQGEKIYRILYWSHGVPVSAYVSEPSRPGHYPLLVNLHGGSEFRIHQHSTFGYSEASVFAQVNPDMVQLYPEYEGYRRSHGLVHGIATDVQNALAGISSAQALGEVNASRLYLLGVSVGGGVALILAGDLPQTRAVVAVSPWVGLVDNMTWLSEHPSGNLVRMAQFTDQYGPNNIGPPSLSYQQRSPQVSHIHAPVLMLQGTADHHVVWQTVQMFANQLKAAHKTYRLILDPGGHHGLRHHYLNETTAEVEQWFHTYGLTMTTY